MLVTLTATAQPPQGESPETPAGQVFEYLDRLVGVETVGPLVSQRLHLQIEPLSCAPRVLALGRALGDMALQLAREEFYHPGLIQAVTVSLVVELPDDPHDPADPAPAG
jgi:hypothetical protein